MWNKILYSMAFSGASFLWPELVRYMGTLRLMFADANTMQNVTAFKQYEVKFRNILKGCEDVIILEDKGLALLSCDPHREKWNILRNTLIDPAPSGALYQWSYTDPNSVPQPFTFENFGTRALSDFHPLGIGYDEPSSRLYVVNYVSYGPTIEVFDYVLGSGPPVAMHRATIKHDRVKTPNSIHALNGTSFLTTNSHYFLNEKARFAISIETYAAVPGGNVVQVSIPADLSTPDRNGANTLSPADVHVRKVASRIAFANGITVVNVSTVAVASTGGRSVRLYDLSTSDNGDVSLSYKTEVRAPAMLDNVYTDGRGRLLAAGHPRPGALNVMTNQRIRCIQLRARAIVLTAAEKAELEQCSETFDATAPSWVAELVVNGRDFAWRELLAGNPGYGTSAGVARDSKEGIVVVCGSYEKGLFVGRE